MPGVEEFGGGRARDHLDGDRRRWPGLAVHRLVHQCLYVLGRLVLVQVARGIGDRPLVTHAEDGERGVPRRSLAKGPLEGPP